MPLTLAPRMARFGASPTAGAMARAAAAKADGRPVISLTTGEPDFDTPAHIRAAAAAAIEAGQTRYTAVDGTPELKRAVRAKFSRENGLSFDDNQVIVSTGAKQAIFNAVLAVIGPGDEAVIPTPCWVSYPDIVRLAGGNPILVQTNAEAGFKPTAGAIADAITSRTRLVMLNSPCNPSGAVLGVDALQEIGEVLATHPQVVAICDDIYEHLLFDGREFSTLAAVCPGLSDRVLTVNGVSKAYAMTGWRIGYAAGPAALIGAMRALQSQSTTNACSVAQAAAVEALNGGSETVVEQRRVFEARRDRFCNRLEQIGGLALARPDGAFYAFVDVSALIGRRRANGIVIEDEAGVVDGLLDDQDLGVVGGAGFCASSPYVRFTFAASEAELDAAADRVAAFVDSLSPPG